MLGRRNICFYSEDKEGTTAAEQVPWACMYVCVRVFVSEGPVAVKSSENKSAQHVSLEVVVSPSQAGPGGGGNALSRTYSVYS